MYRVLLVDDEVLVREAISTNIKWNDLGFELAGSCQDGKEAIEFLEKNSVDVVLTDICMPHVDGMELSKFIYNHFNETSIIIFSGFEDFEYAQKAIKYNVKEYLLKPITAFELSEVLSTLKEDMDKKKEAEEKYGKLNETYNKNRLLIESKVLVDLITGSKTQTENDIALRDANITLSASHYRVAIIEIDDNSELYHHDEITKQQSSLMAFAVFNICDEIIKQKEAGMVCLGNDNRVFILFQSNKPEKFKSEIKDICYEISSNVKQYMKLSITIGIGCYVKYQKDIHKSYESAVDSMKYQYLLDENSIIDMEDIISNFNRDIELEDKIDTLILAIKMNIRDNIEQVFKQLEETMKKAYADKNICDLYLQQIVLTLNSTLKTSNLYDSDIYIYKNQLLSDIAQSKTLKEALSLLKTYCIKVSEEIEIQKNIGGKKHALLALDYIEKNYSDQELNLNSICSYLSISASRFSTIFKNITGETFMEALSRIRIQKAKDLLESTDFKNYEIAEKVGFSDPHYFSIAFKKMTGKTPSEYAKEKR